MQAEQKKTALRLQETLENPKHTSLFAEFLEGEFNLENLLFYLDCSQYQQLVDQEEMDALAVQIYEKYIPVQSKMAVNLPSEVQQEITKLVTTGPPFQRTLFQRAQFEAFQNMRADPFPRFLKSMYYSSLISQTYKNKLSIPDQIFEEFIKEAAENSNDGWGEVVVEKLGVRLYHKYFKTSTLVCVRGCTTIKAPMEEVFGLATDLSRAHLWDDLFHKGRLIEKLDQDMDVLHLVWRNPNIITYKRDFVALRIEKRNPKAYVSVMRSVVHKEAPPSKKYIRSDLLVMALIVQPDPDNARQCHVTYIFQMDPKGTNLTAMDHQSFRTRPLVLQKLRSTFEAKEMEPSLYSALLSMARRLSPNNPRSSSPPPVITRGASGSIDENDMFASAPLAPQDPRSRENDTKSWKRQGLLGDRKQLSASDIAVLVRPPPLTSE